MGKNIYISAVKGRKRVAFTENSELIEFHAESDSRQKIVGNIYKGQVVNVLPGMQAAFVKIGLVKNAFLYVGDMIVEKEDVQGSEMDEPRQLSIKTGDEVMIQVVKEQMGTKGARVTTDISLPGRLLVLMPLVNYVGVSKKIIDEKLRVKLYEYVNKIKPPDMGFVVRTAAANASLKDICADIDFLVESWFNIKKRYESAKVMDIIHEEGDLVFRTVRDMYSDEVEHVYVNDKSIFDEVDATIKRISPKRKSVTVYFDSQEEMFEHFNLIGQLDSLLEKTVRLNNGATLIIDKTEALTIIDINTGKYVGDNNLEETVFNTNILAAIEIARQIRLRNIGGIIICDFIDMVTDEHREKVLEVLSQNLAKDRIRTSMLGMTGLGLVEITRKKTHNEISTVLLQDCPYCNGSGHVHSNDYVSFKIRAKLLKFFKDARVTGVLIRVNPVVSDYFNKTSYFSEDIQKLWQNRRLYVIPDPNRHIHDFEIVPLQDKIYDLPEGAQLLY